MASQTLADAFESQLGAHAYACGLLHDIGKVAKFKVSSKSFFKEARHSLKKKISSHSTETKRNFLKHDLLGALVIQKWGLSEVVENTTLWHHTPNRNDRLNMEDPPMHKLTDIVILANHYIHRLEFGNSGHQTPDRLPADLLRRLRLSSDQADDCLEKVRIALKEEDNHLAIFLKID